MISALWWPGMSAWDVCISVAVILALGWYLTLAGFALAAIAERVLIWIWGSAPEGDR